MPNSLPPSSIWIHVPILTPERRVWRAVLGQACADSELELFSDGSEPKERTRGRGFLRADSAEETAALSLVCDFADVPLDRVILWARRRYPVEDSIEKRPEYGGATAGFADEQPASAEKRKLCSRTPQSGDSQPAEIPA